MVRLKPEAATFWDPAAEIVVPDIMPKDPGFWTQATHQGHAAGGGRFRSVTSRTKLAQQEISAAQADVFHAEHPRAAANNRLPLYIPPLATWNITQTKTTKPPRTFPERDFESSTRTDDENSPLATTVPSDSSMPEHAEDDRAR